MNVFLSDRSFPSSGLRSPVFGRWSVWRTGGVSPSAVMLRILLVLLACSKAFATKPSSKPAMQPVSMQKRLQTLLHHPSRSALADVLHGPYPPDARPAYKRAVHGLIVVGMFWVHMMPLYSSTCLSSQLESPYFKDLLTRCKWDVLGSHYRCLTPIISLAAFIAPIEFGIRVFPIILVYLPAILWIVGDS